MVTTRPMNHGTALSDSATNNSTTNSAANSHFAWRAKCHRNAISPPGGSGFSGAAVGVRNRSKNANICGWLQGLCGRRQSTCQEAGNRPRGASSRQRFWPFSPAAPVSSLVTSFEERSDEAILGRRGDRFGSARNDGEGNTKGIAMKRLVGALVALLAFDSGGAGADLSDASDHHAGRLSARRPDRHAGAHPGRRDAAFARPERGRRNRQRRQRHDRDRARRPRQPGRLYDRHRQLDEPCRLAGDLRARLRHLQGLAADLAAGRLAAVDRRQERSAAEDRARADRLVEGETGPGHVRHRRLRQRRASVRPVLCAEDRRAVSIRALSRRRAGDAGFDRRPDRPVLP